MIGIGRVKAPKVPKAGDQVVIQMWAGLGLVWGLAVRDGGSGLRRRRRRRCRGMRMRMKNLLAVAVTGFRRRWISLVLVGVLVAASAPTWVLQRQPTGKGGGSDLAQLSSYVEHQARPGDALSW